MSNCQEQSQHLRSILAHNVRQQRLHQHLTQRELGQRAHVSLQTIWFIEHGSINSNLETIIKIADVLCCSVPDLLKEDDCH